HPHSLYLPTPPTTPRPPSTLSLHDALPIWTVTEGKIELVEVTPVDGASRTEILRLAGAVEAASEHPIARAVANAARGEVGDLPRSEEHTSELQSRFDLVCRLLLEKKKNKNV